MVSKERVDRSKLCFRVIRPMIIFIIIWRIIFVVPSFISSSFFHHFLFDSPFLLVPFFNIFVLFLLIFIFLRGELNISWNSNFPNLPSSIRHLTAYSSRGDFSSPLPPSVGGDPWSGYWRKLSGSKGKLSNNFLYQWRNGERWPFLISNIVT